MNLREQTLYAFASATTVISASLSWFLNSPLLGVVTGILLGALVTDISQSRTQKRAVKRDLALQNIDRIYSPLYNEMGSIEQTSKAFNYLKGYQELPQGQWSRISSEYYYHFIDQGVRKELVTFYDRVTKFNRLLYEVRQKVDELTLRETERSFGFAITSIMYGISLDGMDASAVLLTNYLLFQVHPKKAFESDARYSKGNVRHYVYYSAKKSGSPDQYSNQLRETKDLEKFDKFYDELLAKVNQMQEVKSFRETLVTITESLPGARSSVLQMIQEPWSNL